MKNMNKTVDVLETVVRSCTSALQALLFLVLAGCYSVEDYMHPSPDVPTSPDVLHLEASGVTIGYDPAFGPLPVVEVSLDGQSARALIATRHGWHAIAADVVPADAPVIGQATVPVLSGEDVATKEREVVQVARIQIGEAVLEGVPLMVEELPDGIDLLLTPAAFRDSIITFDGPRRELRIRPGQLPGPRESGHETIRLALPMLSGSSAAKASRWWSSLMVAAATELDGPLLVGVSTSTVTETHRGPELLPIGLAALEDRSVGAREVSMEDVFGWDAEDTVALEVGGLGSGWLVLGSRFLARHVLELDPTHRLARLDWQGGGAHRPDWWHR